MGGTGIAARPSEAGMTLIEMLIVLAIIAVMAGAVSLGMGSVTRAPSVETEARRLATRLQAAADDAMLGDRTIAFTAQKAAFDAATTRAIRNRLMRNEAVVAVISVPSQSWTGPISAHVATITEAKRIVRDGSQRTRDLPTEGNDQVLAALWERREYVLGVNYWVGASEDGTDSTRIFDREGTGYRLRPAAEVVRSYFAR